MMPDLTVTISDALATRLRDMGLSGPELAQHIIDSLVLLASQQEVTDVVRQKEEEFEESKRTAIETEVQTIRDQYR